MVSLLRKKGDLGEEWAADYLKKQGYKIIQKNVSCRHGEVDLIAIKQKSLFFVEIRRKTTTSYGSALESLDRNKLKKFWRTAEYLYHKNQEWQKRIPYLSVLTIDNDEDGNPKIEFLPNAIEDEL